MDSGRAVTERRTPTSMSGLRLRRFVRAASGVGVGVGVGKDDLKRFSDLIHAKLHHQLVLAEATAKAV
jgi:hypothetical protein